VRLLLIAHAATGAGAASGDGDLTAGARARAAEVGRLLPRPRSAFTSPAPCARQTAAALGVSATVAGALADWDLGRFAGRPPAALHAEAPDAVGAWRTDPAWAGHGGESLDALLARAAGWLALHESDPGTVAAVTHAAVVRAAVVVALPAAPRSFWTIDVAPCSVTELSRRDARWHVARVNWEPALLHIPQRRGRRRHHQAPA